MVLFLALACAPTPPEAQQTPAEFCDLVRGVGTESAGGDPVVLDCGGDTLTAECDSLDDTFLITDEATLAAAGAACSDENTWWNTTEVIFLDTCLDGTGRSRNIIRKTCVHAAAL